MRQWGVAVRRHLLGFGLPELMFCVAILAVVATFVFPSVMNYYKREALRSWVGAISQAEVAIRSQRRRDSSSFLLNVEYDLQTDRWCIAGVKPGSSCNCSAGANCDVVAQSVLENRGVFNITNNKNLSWTIPDAMRQNSGLVASVTEQFPLSVEGGRSSALLKVAIDELGHFAICASDAREYLTVVKSC